MQIIPAIDLKDGKVVNLIQGRLDESTTYSDDPVATADRWVAEGASRLHLVDLDGAFAGKPVNREAIAAIAARHPDLVIQLGGGIRSPEAIEACLKVGVDQLIIGTRAVQQPDFVGEMCRRFPGHIMVGLDGRDGMVAINGWQAVTDTSVEHLAGRFEDDGIEAIVYTDIGRDGMMQGVNIAATRLLANQVSVPVIASGGVADIHDIELLCRAGEGVSGRIAGVITGRAIYEGTLSLAAAMSLAADA